MQRFVRTISVLGLVALTALSACQPAGDSAGAGDATTAPPTVTHKDVGDYVIHFNALPTDQLTAEVARSYGIVRSASRAMLNVSVIKKREGQLGEPVVAKVSASATNLTGQLKSTNIREVREGEAIYYIGELPVANDETLTFHVQVTPEDGLETYPIRFQKQFYSRR